MDRFQALTLCAFDLFCDLIAITGPIITQINHALIKGQYAGGIGFFPRSKNIALKLEGVSFAAWKWLKDVMVLGGDVNLVFYL